jgi:hypothetical protein
LWLLQGNKHRSQPSSAPAAAAEFADAQLALQQDPDEGHPKTATGAPLIATFETEIVKHLKQLYSLNYSLTNIAGAYLGQFYKLYSFRNFPWDKDKKIAEKSILERAKKKFQ